MPPLVSIGIPTFNRAQLLLRAIQSAVNQTYQTLEIIVSDDGSSDGTAEVVFALADPRVRLIRHERNVGMFRNMNSCLDAAEGEFFLMLSDDDYLEPIGVSMLVDAMRRHASATMAYGQWWYHADSRAVLQMSSGPSLEPGIDYVEGYWLGERPTILHGVLFRTSTLRTLGGVPSGYAQDALLTLRAAMSGDVAFVPKPVTNYCIHSGSTTRTLSLARLINDRAMLLEETVRMGEDAGIDPSRLRRLNIRSRRQLAYEAAFGLMSVLIHFGHSGFTEQERRLRSVMSARPLLSLLTRGTALLAPGWAVRLLGRFR